MTRYCLLCGQSKADNSSLRLFKVPENDLDRKKWARATGKYLSNSGYVCSIHFRQGFIGRRKLKKTAVPVTVSRGLMMTNEAQIILYQADAVCFDVDSTVIREEGIDELAKFCDKGEEVAKLTASAMGGNMTFQEALKIRLDILQPKLSTIRQFLKTKPPTLSPGISKLVGLLHTKGIPVYLISGGFKCIIAPVAAQLNIPYENIFANRLKFYFNGDYAGFDENEPTVRTGGKAVVIDRLKKSHNYQNLVLVGDGATDLEACPPADTFIGYGGNVIRPLVKSKAKWFITSFDEIFDLLNT